MADLHATGAFTLEEAARRIGRCAWLEMRLFEVLGSWVPTVPELDVKPLLGAHAHHHAWHAELWHERLPKVPGLSPDELVAPANDGVEAFVTALAESVAPEHTIEKLVGVYRVVLPHAIAAYSHHRDRTTPVADGPTIRALDLVLRDEIDDWRDGARVLATHLRTGDDVRRAADHQARLETLLVAAGGICGPGTFG